MNKHAEQDQVSLYLDGQLTETQTLAFEAHLKSCDLCRTETSSQQDLKLRFAKIGRHPAPSELLKQLRKDYAGESWRPKASPLGYFGLLWKPVGALTLATAVFSVWMMNRKSDESKYIDLEPLMARHARYSAESIVPPADMFASNYSAHLASYRQGDRE